MDYQDTINEARRRVDREIALREVLIQQQAKHEADLTGFMQHVKMYDKTAMLLNALGEERQFEAQQMIEGLVTRGLQAIFEPNLSLVISTSVKGRSNVTEFLIRTQVDEENFFETNVMDARGGGLVAVVGFLLRVTVLLLTQPEGKRFLLIDESFAHLSAEYLEGVGNFLRELVDETGLQIVMVTHQEELAAAATSSLRFSQDSKGRTKVVVI